MARVARDPIDTILGEAGGKTVADRYRDMLHVASTMVNRATATGQSLQSIVSATTGKGRKQYDAYGKALPAGTAKMRALAEMALNQVLTTGPVTTATFMATPKAVGNLPKGLNAVTQTAAHVYFEDPQNRAIATAQGYVTPSRQAVSLPETAYAPTPAPRGAVASIEAMAAPKVGFEALAPNGLVGAASPTNVAGYSRAALQPGAVGILDAVSAVNPGIGVNSGHRTPAQNRAAKGATNSQHLRGQALDLDISGLTDAQKAEALNAAVEAGARGVGLYSSGNVMHVDARTNPAVWGAVPGAAFRGMPVSRAPSWAQPALNDMFAAGQFAVTPRNTPPAPTAKPAPDTMVAGAFNPSRTDLVPTRSTQTVSVPGTVNDLAQAATDFGIFDGPAGAVAGVPARSVQSISITPENVDTALAPKASAPAFAPEAPAAKADLAKVDDEITEVAATPVGTPATLPSRPVTPTPAAALQAWQPAPVEVPVDLPAPIEMPPAIAPVEPVAYTPPAPAAVPAAPEMPSIPSGAQAAYGFHSGLNNAAIASNGNTLSRDAFGNTYNYSPEFDVTTISDPAGNTVGVRDGKVTAENAGSSTGKGLFSGTGLGNALGSALSNDNLSNAVVGGLGGLGGAMVGGLLGPVGGIIGSALGRHLAVQHNPFARNITPQEALLSGNFTRGLGFPDAPSGRSGRGSNRSHSEMSGFSPSAADAISGGYDAGLY